MGTNKSHIGMVVRKLLIEQKKTLIFLTCGYLGICAIFGLWCGFLGSTPGEFSVIPYILFAGFVCAAVTSKTFFEMVSKGGRIAVLMTPATPLEKTLPRIIAVLPGMVLLCIAGYFAYAYADLLAVGITYGSWQALSPECGNFFFSDGDFENLFLILAIFLFNEGIFMFGAIAWPKKSFIKTIVIYAGLQCVFSFITMWVVQSFGVMIFLYDHQIVSYYSVMGLFSLIGVGLMVASYYKFKNASVIPN